MAKLTACLIVRDEAEWLERCLSSLSYSVLVHHEDGKKVRESKPIYDELIVLDTGSVDNTVEIAERFGARVERMEWQDDHALARNHAESFATGDYIFWIDGDETLTLGHELIRKIVEAGEEEAVRPVCRGSIKDDAPHLRQELLRKRGNGVWQYPVHENLTCQPGRPEAAIVYQHHDRTQPRDPALDDRWAGLRKRLTQSFDSQSLGYLAREYGQLGMWGELVAFAELALAQLHPEQSIDDSELAILLGNAYRMLNQPARAEEAYHRAIREYGGWAEPFYSLGLLCAQAGRPDRAVPWLTASLTMNPIAGHMPFGEDLYRWRREALLGQCYGSLGRFEQAYALLTDAASKGGREVVAVALAACEEELKKAARNDRLTAKVGSNGR